MTLIKEGALMTGIMKTPEFALDEASTNNDRVVTTPYSVKGLLRDLEAGGEQPVSRVVQNNSINDCGTLINRYEDRDQSHEFKSVENFAKRQDLKAKFVDALEGYCDDYPSAWSVVKALKSCKAYVAHANGKPSAHYQLCKNRWCPVCSAKIREDRRNEIGAMVSLRKKGWKKSKLRHKTRIGFITLTVKSFPNQSCSSSLAYFNSCWKRMTNRVGFKDLYKVGFGGAYSKEIEPNHETNSFHIHSHILCELPENISLHEVKSIIRHEWSLSGGGWVHAKAVTDLKRELFHHIKYTTKGIHHDAKTMANIISSTRRKRLYGWFGSWKGERKAAWNFHVDMLRKRQEEMVPMVEPSPINPETGELAELEGTKRYSFKSLIDGAKRKCWTSIYLLRWFAYEMWRVKQIDPDERFDDG